jgi:hypothetical protein
MDRDGEYTAGKLARCGAVTFPPFGSVILRTPPTRASACAGNLYGATGLHRATTAPPRAADALSPPEAPADLCVRVQPLGGGEELGSWQGLGVAGAGCTNLDEDLHNTLVVKSSARLAAAQDWKGAAANSQKPCCGQDCCT